MSWLGMLCIGEVDEEAVTVVETHVCAQFGLRTRRLAPLPAPEYAYDPRRRQYNSALILPRLAPLIQAPPAAPPGPISAEAGEDACPALRSLLALTEQDLYIPMLTFVFGQAQLAGPLAIVSLARLRQEFYALPPDRPALFERARKEAVHELGHTFGLAHCADRSCAMSLSSNIGQVDLKRDSLCPACARAAARHLPRG